MSKHLPVAEAVELLERLRSAVRDFAARASKLDEDFRLRTHRERNRRQAAAEDQTRELSDTLAQAETSYAAAKASTLANFEKRKVTIGKAYQASKEQVLQRIDNRLGARKYELQKKMLQAERDRQAGLTGAVATLQQFKTELEAELQTLSRREGEAQRSFKGYGKFQRQFLAAYEKVEIDSSADENRLLAQMRELIAKAQQELKHFHKLLLVGLFRHLWIWIVLAMVAVLLIPMLSKQPSGFDPLVYKTPGIIAAAGLVVVFILRMLGQGQAAAVALNIATALAKGRHCHDAGLEKADAHHRHEVQRLHDEFQSTTQAVDQQLKQAIAEAGQMRVSTRMQSDEKTVRITARHEELHRARMARLEREHHEHIKQLKLSAEEGQKSFAAASEELERKNNADYEGQWQSLEAEWQSTVHPLYQTIESVNATSQKLFPPWDAAYCQNWTPPASFEHAAKFAQLDVAIEKLSETAVLSKRLALPGASQFSVPLTLVYPEAGSIVFETSDSGREVVLDSLNNIMLRLLSVTPPGRINFSIIDPVGLGQGFAGIMHLADYEEQLITSRIWTQSNQIEQRLADLNEHMEKVIQMYLRNEYQTIAKYNEQAGVIAEKYHFLVVSDFPVNFSDTATKRLMSIVTSGARCGVYLLLHWDRRQPLPPEFAADDVRKNTVWITRRGQEFMVSGKAAVGAELALDSPPAPDLAIEFIQRVGKLSRDSSRVEVPFDHVTPSEAEIWSEDTTREVRVGIGRTGATKLQYLEIGKGTRQHGLIAGKTGSGKSTLFHIIITNLALWCSPEQVEFYLVDFKKGVEFKCYASRRLPHARVVAIESDREFALSVLQRVDDELKRRGDMFRKLGVQDIAGYKKAGGTEAIPRTLLIVDEFQEFFVEDDKIAQTSSLLLDRIVRQGRAFGIHVILGSQTLGGAYTVARTTLGQMVIRIALQCNEADAYLIMDDTNPAPRLLSRPGEGIYNDTAGSVQGNSPFQAVWLPEDVRDQYLAKVRARADQNGGNYPAPIVFEGNIPADISENTLLRSLLEAEAVKRAVAGRIWLGAPNSIKGPTEAVFYRQGGNNLLVVGQREEASLAIVTLGLLALAAQYPIGAARFILLDSSPPGSPQRDFLDRVIRAIPHKINLARQSELGELMKELVDEMKQRTDDEQSAQAATTFLFIHGMQKFNKLRFEEDFGFSSSDAEAAPNPSALLNTLLSDGTRLGYHVIATCDTYNNVNRFLSRKALTEFEMRVLFQMSANDSASLIDNPKASTLGLHRALYYNEQEGHLETFRPYALPTTEWIEETENQLKRLLQPAAILQG